MAELHVELVSVEREVWSGEATQVVAKTTEGEYDHIPEQAFFLCGGIEDVEANAKKLAG
ncbi:MAG: atpD [Frankiales bacterium]|nr:atpD [Frankiales bacterium]